MNCCCQHTYNDSPCLSITPSEIDNLIFQLRFEYNKQASKVQKNLAYGYGSVTKHTNRQEKILLVQSALEDLYRSLINNASICLDCNRLNLLIDKARGLTTKYPKSQPRTDLHVDDSGETAWLVQNPYCASYEKWEKLAYTVCEQLTIDIELLSREVLCDLTFDIARNIVTPGVLRGLSAYSQACQLEWEITRTKKECEIDYELLLEKVEDCDITLEFYNELIDHNITYSLIAAVYKAGLSFEIVHGCPFLVTPTNRYNMHDLQFDTLVTDIDTEVCQAVADDDLVDYLNDYTNC